MTELHDFARFQRYLRRPLSFGSGFALFALGLGAVRIRPASNQAAQDQTKIKLQAERDEKPVQRVEEMVNKPKSFMMVARADEVRGRRKSLDVIAGEKEGWFWKGRERVLRVKKGPEAAPNRIDA